MTKVPFDERSSNIDQEPSDRATSTACSLDTPGSSGAWERSISGKICRETLLRPMRIRLPMSGIRLAWLDAGNWKPLAVSPRVSK